MSTALITHDACEGHVTPPGHPEQVARLRAALAGVEGPEFQDLVRVEAPRVSTDAILRAHSQAHLDAVLAAIPQQGFTGIDGDTFAAPGSLEAAYRAAGAVVEAVNMVLDGEVGNAFCAIRPPGHHAERDRAMGFCLFNNAAIGALHAIEARGLERVAIIDFDVHHGNGTQDIFERDARVFYGSTHEWPLYPGTGAEHEVGLGNIANVQLPALTGSMEFREAFEVGVVMPMARFRPNLIIISAGFDAHGDDPLAQLLLHEQDFAWATEQLCRHAKELCDGHVVSTLEGGYDLDALRRSTAAHVRALVENGVR